MKCNIEKNNRIARISTGILFIAMFFFIPYPISMILLAIGIITLAEGLSGYCIYHAIRKTKSKR